MLRSFAIAAFRHGEATASRRFTLDWERAITNSTATCSHAGWANQGRTFCRATEDDGEDSSLLPLQADSVGLAMLMIQRTRLTCSICRRSSGKSGYRALAVPT